MNRCRRIMALVSAILIILSAGILPGCTKRVITLVSDVITVAQGEELSNDVSDYVRASKAMLEEMTLDVASVDVNVPGDYRATVTYGEEVRTFTIRVKDLTAPVITLVNGEIFLEGSGEVKVSDVVASIEDFSEYIYGFSDDMTKADKDKVVLLSLRFDEVGDHVVEVIAKDANENISVKEVTIHVVAKLDDIPGENPENPDTPGETQTNPGEDVVVITDYREYMNKNSGADANNLQSYDSMGVYFGTGNRRDPDTNRPNLAYYINQYPNLAVDFIQPNSRFVWLTFNETIERGNTEVILDILKEKKVSAVFFVTLPYAQKNPNLIKRMIDEGHVIGNFTSNCVKVADLSVNELTTELNALYNYLQDTYGYSMYLFRAPSGYYNERALALAESLGYRTVFWSYSYADWDMNNQVPVPEALANALNGAHGGAIYLFGGSSTTNRDMLSDFIDGIRAKKYEFAVYQKI